MYTATIFLGALLLFLVQPMAGRAVLPSLGGSPAVWNTCMLFFQGSLLGGYAYAHGLLRIRRTGIGVGIHALVLLAGAAALPWVLQLPAGSPAARGPIVWLLGALAVGVGAPFFALAATGPLVQGWLARSGQRGSRDPYFLYAASNAGSMLALLAYPLAVEPLVRLGDQARWWGWGYLVFAGAMVACGVLAARSGRGAEDRAGSAAQAAVSGRTRLRWVVLAFIPSSLMLGVTQYISTDIAPVPLLWVVPLAVYLLSFILVFSWWGGGPAWAWSRVLTLVVIGLAVAFVRGAREPVVPLIGLHVAGLLAASMVCHGRLAAARPSTDRLTEFYLLVAVGGVLGGVCNAIVAPMVFTAVAEYPLVLAAACLFRVGRRPAAPWGWVDVAWASGLVAVYGGLAWAAAAVRPGGLSPEAHALVTIALPVGVPIFVCYLFSKRNLRFALAVGGILVGALLLPAQDAAGIERLYSSRTFFGTYRVEAQSVDAVDARGLVRADPATGEPVAVRFHRLMHGTTMHGLQNLAEPGVPLIYYHPDGPIGQVMAGLAGDARLEDVGLVGLGCGAMAAYGGAGRSMTFFEIDPEVVRIATDAEFFTFLADAEARGTMVEHRLGDGRLMLAAEPAGAFGLIVLDAFSSDAIPVHLLTREALEVYLSRLAPGGVLAFHVSNRHLDLEPVLAAGAAALGLEGVIQENLATAEEMSRGRSSSTWAVLARSRKDLAFLSRDVRWRPLLARKGFAVWTDDFSNIWGVFR